MLLIEDIDKAATHRSLMFQSLTCGRWRPHNICQEQLFYVSVLNIIASLIVYTLNLFTFILTRTLVKGYSNIVNTELLVWLFHILHMDVFISINTLVIGNVLAQPT